MGPDILVPLMVFALPAVLVFLSKHYKMRMKMLEMQSGDQRLLAANSELLQKTAELEARVQNLESIVVSSDFDARLAQRLSAPKAAALPVRSERPALRSAGTDASEAQPALPPRREPEPT